MPDNIPISPGQGAVIATDQDPATGAHYQRVKLMDGTEGSNDAIPSDSHGQLDSNPAVISLNLAWDFMLSGFAYFRVRVTAFTSGLAQLQASRYTNATEPSPSVVAHGMSSGNPVAVAVDASGRLTILGPITIAAALGSGSMVPVVGGDGTSSGFARQPTAAIDGTPVNGQTTNQPTFLLIGGTDGIFTVSPSYAAPNPNAVGTARKLLTDSAGVLQVTDSAITLLRQELREANALLLLILQALSGNDMVTGKDGLMPHQLPVQ